MIPAELFRRFGINPAKQGAKMFNALVWLMADGIAAADAVKIVCDTFLLPRPAVYSQIKRTLAPVFDATFIQLQACGLSRPKTVPELAKQLSDSIENV